MSIRAALTALTFIPIVAGCARQGPNTRSAVGPKWVVDSGPVTDIGGTTPSGDVAFLSVVGAVRLSNGTIVVGDNYASAIRYFDSLGQRIRSVGREGNGPGEFRAIHWIGRCGGDSVFVWDTRAVTVLTSSGAVARTFRVPADTIGAPQPVFIACGPGSAIALLAPNYRAFRINSKSAMPVPGVLVLADRTGHLTRTVDSVSIAQQTPFGHRTQLALSTDRVFVGPEDSARVLVFGLDGSSRGSLAIGIDGRPVSDREYERAIEQRAAVFSDETTRKQNIELMRRVPKPQTLAPYSALFAVGHDTLWAQVSAPGDSVTVLDAVGPDGKPAGEARIPRDLRVLDMGRDFILGEYDAPDGDQHVALYRMHPPH